MVVRAAATRATRAMRAGGRYPSRESPSRRRGLSETLSPSRPIGRADQWRISADADAGGGAPADSLTRRIFDGLAQEDQAGGQGGAGGGYAALQRADAAWAALRERRGRSSDTVGPAPQFVTRASGQMPPAGPDVLPGAPPLNDVIVAGGTLGIFTAVALQNQGFRVVSQQDLFYLYVTGVLSESISTRDRYTR